MESQVVRLGEESEICTWKEVNGLKKKSSADQKTNKQTSPNPIYDGPEITIVKKVGSEPVRKSGKRSDIKIIRMINIIKKINCIK